MKSRLLILLLPGVLFAAPPGALAAGEQTFATVDAAVSALRTAAARHDTNALHAIFGPEGRKLVSPDAVQATAEYLRFVQRLAEKTQWVTNSDSCLTLDLGADAWPFPIPLAKAQGRWFFDTAAGAAEILNRRIGQDELGAIEVCRAYVEAQREYASQDRLINGRMLAGFALVAWPAEWANSGVMTFIVNQQGKVYQRNLGRRTARLAAAITRFDPDPNWTPTP